MMFKYIATGAIACAIALAPSMASADTSVDIEAWAKQHKSEISFFVGVNVDECEGLKGLSYESAVDMADLRDIDLDALVKKTDADEILKYIDESGLTLGQLKLLIDDFCAGEIPVPPPVTDKPTPTVTPTGSSASPSVSPSTGAPVKPGVKGPDGSMAETGGMSPWLPTGIAATLIGAGSGIFLLRRKGVL